MVLLLFLFLSIPMSLVSSTGHTSPNMQSSKDEKFLVYIEENLMPSAVQSIVEYIENTPIQPITNGQYQLKMNVLNQVIPLDDKNFLFFVRVFIVKSDSEEKLFFSFVGNSQLHQIVTNNLGTACTFLYTGNEFMDFTLYQDMKNAYELSNSEFSDKKDYLHIHSIVGNESKIEKQIWTSLNKSTGIKSQNQYQATFTDDNAGGTIFTFNKM